MILLTGFGPFRDVTDNPSARLVRAVRGLAAAGHRIEALVLPVRWGEATRLTLAEAARLRPALVLGFGVATARVRVEVEATARADREGADAAGAVPGGPREEGPPRRDATLDVDRLAACLGGARSDDAGTYLCNAWLYEVPAALPCPAGFVHLPPDGLAPARLLEALDRYLLGPTPTSSAAGLPPPASASVP